jgi:DNA-binding transcriptional regulator YiaG
MRTATKEKRVTWQRARESGTALFLWRRAVGLNREMFAQIANFSERSLATYEKRRQLPVSIRPQVNEAVRLVKALLEIIPADDLPGWLKTPNRGLGGQRPWTLIKRGEKDLLWAMIYQTRQGAFA